MSVNCTGTFKCVHRRHTEGADDRLEQAGDGGSSSVAQTRGGGGCGGGLSGFRINTQARETSLAVKAAEQHEEC